MKGVDKGKGIRNGENKWKESRDGNKTLMERTWRKEDEELNRGR